MAKHHYLPQFYLQGFTDPDTPPDHEPCAWVYRFDSETWDCRAPKNIAAESNLYAIEDASGEQGQEVEMMLAKVESIAAEILRHILGQHPLSIQQRAEFATFIHIMHARVPGQLGHVGEFIAEVMRKTLTIYHRSFTAEPEKFEAFKKRIKEEAGIDLDDIRPEDLYPDHFEISTHPVSSLGMALSATDVVTEILRSMGWVFWVSTGENYFITSDYPYCLIDPSVSGEMFYSPGLAAQNIEVTLPLARNMGLLIGHKTKGTRWKLAEAEVVAAFNLRTAMRAEFIVTPKTSFPGWESIRSSTRVTDTE